MAHRDHNPPRNCVLLYVEDDDTTAYLFQMALEEAGIQARCFRVTDGHQALEFLSKQGVYADAPVPDLVILDLNLPKVNGFDVLAEVRCKGHRFPVAIYSSSSDPRDRQRAIELGADSFITKGGDLEDFVGAARAACALIRRDPLLPSNQ